MAYGCCGAARNSVLSLVLRLDNAWTVYPVWFENAARLARDQEG
ncbi:hypothetical protein FHY30_001073 [Xanthomonas arboricola]|nr:hypothetical protein [Xanthomonas campestris]